MNSVQAPPAHDDLSHRLAELLRIGAALSKERDINRLLEAILVAAKDITRADGGTLYRMTDDRQALRFEIMRNDTLGISMGGTSGEKIPFYPVNLFDKEGKAINSMVAAYTVHHDCSVNIADAYTEAGFDFSGTKNFEDGLPFDVFPDGTDEKPRGRNHRRAAADQCQKQRHWRSRPFFRR